MEMSLNQARIKLGEIEKKYKNPIISQSPDISHFFTHVEVKYQNCSVHL